MVTVSSPGPGANTNAASRPLIGRAGAVIWFIVSLIHRPQRSRRPHPALPQSETSPGCFGSGYQGMESIKQFERAGESAWDGEAWAIAQSCAAVWVAA